MFPSRRTYAALFSIAALAVAGSCRPIAAQTPVATVPPLQVQADYVQVPVLAYDTLLHNEVTLETPHFNVLIDHVHPVTVESVRSEGDEAADIIVLLDLNSPMVRRPQMAKALAQWSKDDVGPNDRLSVYTLHCHLRRLGGNSLRGAALNKIVLADIAHTAQTEPTPAADQCKGRWGLRDALLYLAYRMNARPGWHTIFAVTDGADTASTHTWETLRIGLNLTATTVIGIMPEPDGPHDRSFEPFAELCGRSGGIVVFARPNWTDQALFLRAMQLIRNRYILEFPRPPWLHPGMHIVSVLGAGRDQIYYPAGLSFVVQDSAVKQ